MNEISSHAIHKIVIQQRLKIHTNENNIQMLQYKYAILLQL